MTARTAVASSTVSAAVSLLESNISLPSRSSGRRGLLAVGPPLGVAAVDVDVEVAEVLDQVVEVLRLQLVDVERDALARHGGVDLVAGPGRDQGAQPHAGAQQLHRDADVDLGRS